MKFPLCFLLLLGCPHPEYVTCRLHDEIVYDGWATGVYVDGKGTIRVLTHWGDIYDFPPSTVCSVGMGRRRYGRRY